MIAFIDDHRGAYGVEPICKVLPIAPSTYYAQVARRADPTKRSARARSDAALTIEIRRVFDGNFQVYGVRKVWRQLRREGFDVARCTVARLMKAMESAGRDPRQIPADDGRRQGRPVPARPGEPRLQGASAQQGCGCPISPTSRPGRISSTSRLPHRRDAWPRSAQAGFVLDALEQALHARRPFARGGLVHHSDRGSQAGLKWSSQHLEGGSCDDEAQAAFGSVWSGEVVRSLRTALAVR